MDLISVIIPVYNVENYIERCLDSVINQTYKNLEIILVDDGSTDKSGEICDYYASKDIRIIVIHKENEGQGRARNIALDIAKGEYIAFVDSDDYIENNTYEIMYESLRQNNCNIAMCGNYNISENGTINVIRTLNKPTVIEHDEIIKSFLTYGHVRGGPCDKLIHKDLIKNIRFPVGYVCEDIDFVFNLLKNVDKIAHCGKALYYYIQRKGSTSHSLYSEKTMGLYIYHKRVYDLVQKNYPYFKKEAEFFFLSSVINLYKIMYNSKYNGEYFIKIKKLIKTNCFNIVYNKYFSKYQKLMALFISTNTYNIIKKFSGMFFHNRRINE